MLPDREEQRCQRYGDAAGIIVNDLDNLKRVNDAHGHASGDGLLRKSGRVLREAGRGADVVARSGGAEFAVLAVETGAECLQHDRHLLKHQLTSSASPRPSAPPHAGGLDAAWSDADQAMYVVTRQRHAQPPRTP